MSNQAVTWIKTHKGVTAGGALVLLGVAYWMHRRSAAANVDPAAAQAAATTGALTADAGEYLIPYYGSGLPSSIGATPGPTTTTGGTVSAAPRKPIDPAAQFPGPSRETLRRLQAARLAQPFADPSWPRYPVHPPFPRVPAPRPQLPPLNIVHNRNPRAGSLSALWGTGGPIAYPGPIIWPAPGTAATAPRSVTPA